MVRASWSRNQCLDNFLSIFSNFITFRKNDLKKLGPILQISLQNLLANVQNYHLVGKVDIDVGGAAY